MHTLKKNSGHLQNKNEVVLLLAWCRRNQSTGPPLALGKTGVLHLWCHAEGRIHPPSKHKRDLLAGCAKAVNFSLTGTSGSKALFNF